MDNETTYVIKRDGRRAEVNPSKITERLNKLKTYVEQKVRAEKLQVSVWRIAQSTIRTIYDGITTTEIDEEAAEIAAHFSDHPHYSDFAGNIVTSNLEANTRDCASFLMFVEKAYGFIDPNTGLHAPLVSDELLAITRKYSHLIERRINHARNYLYDYFAIQTLIKGRYLRCETKPVQKNGVLSDMLVPFETPQHMWMRVALGVHGWKINDAFAHYDLMSQKFATMATPTLFNAGTPKPQMSSCFLLAMKDDSLPGIYRTLADVAEISKHAGGVGLHISKIRGAGSYIAGTNGTSNGLPPMLRVFNETARYVDQCFAPETWVYTQQGARPIGEVVSGDQVLNGAGKFEQVESVFHAVIPAQDPLITVRTIHGQVLVTPQHPLLALRAQSVNGGFELLAQALDREQVKLTYTEAEQLKEGDWLVKKIPTYVQDVPDFSTEDCWVLGVLLVKGICHADESWTINTQGFPEARRRLLAYLNAHLTEFEEREAHTIYVPPNWSMRANMVRHHTLHPNFWHLPLAKTQALVNGIKWVSTADIQLPSGVEQARNYAWLRLGQGGPVHRGYLFTPVMHTERTTKNVSQPVVDLKMSNEKEPSYVTEVGVAHNGGGKRKGSFAMYLEPWHKDVFEFLELKDPTGAPSERAIDLFYAMWMPDLFWKRLEQAFLPGQEEKVWWSLMDPRACPGLPDVHGAEFEALYTRYEEEKRYHRQVDIKTLAKAIWNSQIKTGTPYILNKDAVNRLSNQKNLGTVKSSNLCVSQETPLLTLEHGYQPIGTLRDQKVHVWNGHQWSPTVVRQTQPDAAFIKVYLSDGSYLVCTKYHKFVLDQAGTRVEAQQLKAGDVLCDPSMPKASDYPNTERSLRTNLAFVQGLFFGGGFTDQHGDIVVDGRPYFQCQDLTENGLGHKLVPPDAQCDRVPVSHLTNQDKAYWFSGYCAGRKARLTPAYTLEVMASTAEEAQQLRLMLHSLGVFARIVGQQQLTIPRCGNLHSLYEAGFAFEQPPDFSVKPKGPPLGVVTVVPHPTRGPSYCFTEEQLGLGVFNGILTGNCAEIVQYSDPDETAVCNLGSMCLPMYVQDGKFNHQQLYEDCRLMIKSLNRVIDRNFYPLESCRRSNMRHRPVGLGVQGLADVFIKMRMRFGGPQSKALNRDIAETMAFASWTESHAMTQEVVDAKTGAKRGHYPSMKENGGAPISHGQFHFDLWGEWCESQGNTDRSIWQPNPALGWDWEGLRLKVQTDGVANSQTQARMPTASTSQIMGNMESFEPYFGMMFRRNTKVGEFTLMCKYLVQDLVKAGLWKTVIHPDTKKPYIPLKEKIKANQGSIQNIPEIPQELKDIYVTVLDVKLKDLTLMARDTAVFTDQSMSLNVYFQNSDNMMAKLLKYELFATKLGLKTVMYYMRTVQDSQTLDFNNTQKLQDQDCAVCSA